MYHLTEYSVSPSISNWQISSALSPTTRWAGTSIVFSDSETMPEKLKKNKMHFQIKMGLYLAHKYFAILFINKRLQINIPLPLQHIINNLYFRSIFRCTCRNYLSLDILMGEWVSDIRPMKRKGLLYSLVLVIMAGSVHTYLLFSFKFLNLQKNLFEVEFSRRGAAIRDHF